MNIQLAAAERLEQAVAVIRKEGWIQKLLWEQQGGVCAIGALFRVQLGRRFRLGDAFSWSGPCSASRITPDDVSFLAGQEIAKVVRPRFYEPCFSDLPNWNDEPERTRDEVIAAMLTAATLLRAKAVSETGTCTATATHFEFPELEWKL